jgi:tRNA1Val (adenine37-N6)-methyltransferase
MSNSYFQFKQFRIEQDKCAMKVGTDGVLLGAWTNHGNAARILDVGAGTGLIAIMMAQRCNALIDAIEIDEPAVAQASENFTNSPWFSRLKIIHISFNEFIEKAVFRYDLIVSNPPYHKESVKSPHAGRQLARYAPSLEYSTIIEAAPILLTSTGRISIILPCAEEKQARKNADDSALFCTRITRMIPSPGKEPSRSLLEFSRIFLPLKEDSIILESNGRHKFSEDYMQLTRDFYLKF